MLADLSKLDFTYRLGATDHWLRSRALIREPKVFRDVIYSGLELRMCIEMTCFEYLHLLTWRTRNLSTSELNLYKPKEILKRVTKESPNFSKTIDFVNAMLEVHNKTDRIVNPDVNWLVSTHGRLNDWLHLRKTDPSDRDKITFITLVDDTITKLKDYLKIRLVKPDLTIPAKQIFDDYVDGKISLSQVKTRLDISNIPRWLLNS